MLKKYVATVFYRGIGNETVSIMAKDDRDAFDKLFAYYRDKSESLGVWLDGDGEDAGDYNYKDGMFENHPDWDWLITPESEIKTIGDTSAA